ncbi:MAG: carboxypeptidase-like regulatory domain-containing protein [Bryobacteraceae bacterium]
MSDSTGAVVSGAAVSITNTATNQIRRVQTNDAGNYTTPFLVPGVYDIQAELAGFKVATRRGLILQVGDVARVDFTLEVGQVTESVEVSASAALISTESTAVGTVIENKRIVELPINGRNFLNLVRLSPNVSAEMGAGGQAGDRQGGERANQAISIAGQRQQFNRYTLDGVENTDVNFNTFIIRPSIDAIQEFKVQTGVYSAEFGRATSQVNATTKSGSNSFHGTAYEFFRNDNMDAKEWRNEGPRNPFVRNQFGFTLGGPVWIPKLLNGRDRLFFMSNFEALRDRKTLQGTASVATDRMRSGDFSAAGRSIFDPLTPTFQLDARGDERAVSALPFANNTIPQARFNPVSLRLLEFYPRATIPGDEFNRNFLRNRGRPINWEQFIQRIDFNENSSSSWFGRFSYGDEFERRLANFEQQEGKTGTKVYQVVISNTRTLSPTMVNEFRAGYNQFQNDQLLRYANERDVTSELGVSGLTAPIEAAWGTPSISLENGISGFGESSEGPYVNRNHTFEFMDNLSVIRGKHTFKLGGEVRRDRYNQVGNQFPRGSFIFQAKATFNPANRAPTGHSFADFLLGESRRSERALGIANTMFRSTFTYLYAEDTWRITPKITLNLGMRYENSPPWHDKYRGIMNVQMFDTGVGPDGLLANTQAPIFTRPGEGDFHEGLGYHFHDAIPKQVGDQHLGRAMVNRDNNDFAPRIGIAYSPTTNWSIRSGFGMFYTQDTGNPRFDMGRNLGGRGRFESNEERPNSNLLDPWAAEEAEFQCSGWTGVCLGPPYVLGNITGRRTPYLMQWLFNVQRQLGDDMALEAGYMGNGGRKLERMRAYNEAILRTGPADNRSIAQRQPWPMYGRIQQVDGSVISNYHALNLKLQKRFSQGLTYLIGYTWSKAIDNGSAIRTNSGDRLFPPNSYDLQAERGLSQFHTGRRFVASFLYDLPFGVGKPFAGSNRVLDKIVGGWQVGSIVTFSDGTPVNVGNIGDRANIGVENWPDATGISPVPDQRTTERFWNIAAFDTTNSALAYRNGTAGRNVLFRPGLRQWDFSLSKNTAIREGHALQFRFEAFNFGNHPNWNQPGGDARNANTFGVVNTARTMREMQLALKYIF